MYSVICRPDERQQIPGNYIIKEKQNEDLTSFRGITFSQARSPGFAQLPLHSTCCNSSQFSLESTAGKINLPLHHRVLYFSNKNKFFLRSGISTQD